MQLSKRIHWYDSETSELANEVRFWLNICNAALCCIRLPITLFAVALQTFNDKPRNFKCVSSNSSLFNCFLLFQAEDSFAESSNPPVKLASINRSKSFKERLDPLLCKCSDFCVISWYLVAGCFKILSGHGKIECEWATKFGYPLFEIHAFGPKHI